jgi:hypothetical protein
MAHIVALLAPVVVVDEEEALALRGALGFSTLPKLLRKLPQAAPGSQGTSIGELRAKPDASGAVAWTGEEWLALREFVYAAGIAAMKLCGRPASVRHKAIITSEHSRHLVRIIELPEGQQRGRFYVHYTP